MLKVAVAGSGYFSQFHYDAWQRHKDVELVALASKDPRTAQERAEQFAVPRTYQSVDDLLESEQVDLLDIVTPQDTHLELVTIAAKRGVNVICQKPLAPTLDTAKTLVDYAENAGITLIVHENFRFMPWYREIRRLIDDGRLGALHDIAFRLRPGDGQGSQAYLDRQPYFQAMPKFLIHETGIHFIDVFRYLMGDVRAVTAELRRANPAIAGEDAGYVIFAFESGSSGLFDGNRLNDHSAENCRLTMGEMHLAGSEGVLRLDGEARLWWKPHGEVEQAHDYKWSRQGFGGDCVYAFTEHAVDHLLRGGHLVNSGSDYLVNMIIEDAIYRSNELGQRVSIKD